MPEWLWQGLLTNGIYAILILGGGLMFGYLKKQGSALLPTFSYAFGGAACVAVVIFCFRGIANMPHTPIQTTGDNVESEIVDWTNSLGIAKTPVYIPDTFFAYKMTLSDGVPVLIVRSRKSDPGYVSFTAALTVGSSMGDLIAKLTDQQATTVLQELTLELARSKLEYSILSPNGPRHLQAVSLDKPVGIPSLNEAEFLQTVDEIDSAVGLSRASLALSIQRQYPQSTPLPTQK